MVLDHIVIDPANPRNIYVSAWNAQDPTNDGDVYRSKDSGRTWDLLADLHGKSIRALAMSASDSKILVAGVLDGVFRSRDGKVDYRERLRAVCPRNVTSFHAGDAANQSSSMRSSVPSIRSGT